MSETSVSLRRKIGVAEDLHSVVRTMKAVAAAAIGQYEASVHALGDYYVSVELGLGACLRIEGQLPYIRENLNPPTKINAVVFGSDQGLVGRFNDTVAEFTGDALATFPGEVRIWAIGERVQARLISLGFPVFKRFELPSSVQGISPLIGEILLENEMQQELDKDSELHLFYNKSKSTTYYAPVSQRLLPLDEKWLQNLRCSPWPAGRYSQVIGDGRSTLGALIREYLFVSLFRACAESLASENASRLAAMQRADKNIDELLKDLNGTFHQLRKDGIDMELFDVVAALDSLE